MHYILALCFLWAGSLAASPPISGLGLFINHIGFLFPHENKKELKVTRAILGPYLEKEMAEKMTADQLRENFRAFVSVSIYAGANFDFEVKRFVRYESVVYQLSWYLPPDATPEELKVFVRTHLRFIPHRDAQLLPMRLRPIGHRPTLWHRCTDWLKFTDPPLLI